MKDRDEITVGPVKLLFIDPDADLMAALKDVPGFGCEDSDLELLDDEASHMGAPEQQNEEGDGTEEEGEEFEGEEASSEEGMMGLDGDAEDQEMVPADNSEGEEASTDELEHEFDEIDPALLAEEVKSNKDWLLVGAVGVLILVTVVLLIAILA